MCTQLEADANVRPSLECIRCPRAHLAKIFLLSWAVVCESSLMPVTHDRLNDGQAKNDSEVCMSAGFKFHPECPHADSSKT